MQVKKGRVNNISHYSKIRSKISDKKCLIKALEDMGFVDKLQVNDKKVNLEGYKGDKREEAAEIVIPRRYVGGAANDIGFVLQNDGTWGAIISEYDSKSGYASKKSKYAKNCKGYDSDWLKRLTQRYAYHKIKNELSNNNFFIENETEENGELLLECSSCF